MIDADEVVRIVQSCPSVARMAAGTEVEVATYLPGRRVPGVRLVDGAIEVHVVARYGLPLLDVADEVHRALAASVRDAPVALFIDDVDRTPGVSPLQ